MPQSRPNKKQQRLQQLARKLARIIHDDIQKNGSLKPSYLSPKFWSHVQLAMHKLEERTEDKND